MDLTILDPIGKIFFSRVSRSVPFPKKKDPRRGGGPTILWRKVDCDVSRGRVRVRRREVDVTGRWARIVFATPIWFVRWRRVAA